MKRYQVSSLAILLSLLVTSNSLSSVSASRSSQSANKDLYSPEIVLVKPAKGGFTTNLNTIVLEGLVLSYKLPLIEITFSQNKTVLFKKKPEAGAARRFPFSVPVKLQPGVNQITIEARNDKGASQLALESIFYDSGSGSNSAKPNLIVLALGISSYHDPSLKLGTAEFDVDEFAKRMSAGGACLFQTPKVKVIKGTETTRRAVLAGLAWLSTEAQSDADVKVIFIRGWTTRDSAGNAFLLTSDHGSDSELEINDVSFELIWRRLKSTRGRSVLLVDTNISGIGAGFSATPWTEVLQPISNVSAVIQTSRPATGESTSHSIFTMALLEALSPKADSSSNRVIDVDELSAWLRKRIPELAKGKLPPTIIRAATVLKPVEFYCAK